MAGTECHGPAGVDSTVVVPQFCRPEGTGLAPEASFLGLQTATFPLCPRRAFSLGLRVPGVLRGCQARRIGAPLAPHLM